MALLRLFCKHAHPRNHFIRLFSSSAPIKPVSYPVKPKDPSTPADESPHPENVEPEIRRPQQRAPRQPIREWNREDARYMKDAPSSISPVSYPAKVAPLPEYTPPSPEMVGTDQEKKEGEEGLRREARKIKSSFFGLVQVEEEKVPYPTLIKPEGRPKLDPMDLVEAIRQVKANAKRNFLETVEAHANLGVNPRRSDQMVRGALTLPHGTGKTVRVAVFAEGTTADEARQAGADVVGGDELIEEIRTGGGKLNFDKCIATPMFMPRLSKVARILGPRGLMPNPKLGSVTSDVSNAVKAAKCGRIDFKIDKTAIVHVGLGKVNFSEDYLRENIGAFVHALLLAKPVGLKKTSKYAGYVKSFTICSTMGSGYPVSIQSLSAAADQYSKIQQVN